jgi:hypothetical protein
MLASEVVVNYGAHGPRTLASENHLRSARLPGPHGTPKISENGVKASVALEMLYLTNSNLIERIKGSAIDIKSLRVQEGQTSSVPKKEYKGKNTDGP